MSGRRLLAAVLSFVLLLGCQRSKQAAAAPAPATLRASAVAGSFYPADKGELAAMVEKLLAQARNHITSTSGERIYGVLVPHAGYVYSGLTAACAFAALDARAYDTVILLGPPHSIAVNGAAVYCGTGFQTPLGAALVNASLARAIASSSPAIQDDPTPHVPEHSLEVQLPFLLSVMNGVKIVPILVMGDPTTLDSVAQGIIASVRKSPGGFDRTLLVISSDLAHYPSAADARGVDRDILAAFCSLDPNRLLAADRKIMGTRTANLVCSMCGLDAAYVGLQVLRAAGASGAHLLDTRTSADAGVEGATADRAVGYGAVAITGPAAGAAQGSAGAAAAASLSAAQGAIVADWIETHSQLLAPINAAERKFLLHSARRSIEEYLKVAKGTPPVEPMEAPHLGERRGCFVTLYLRSSSGGRELRGCIGMHESSVPLSQLVPQLALASAFGDPRFIPLGASELPRVQIEISVYRSTVVAIPSADEFIVGKHGIILRVSGSEATFLPEVASEQGWDKTATLENLCLKAGLPTSAWKSKDARFSIYETQAFGE